MLHHRIGTKTVSKRPKLALVGNAPPAYDLSAQIESCDIVIRCNEAKTLGNCSGGTPIFRNSLNSGLQGPIKTAWN